MSHRGNGNVALGKRDILDGKPPHANHLYKAGLCECVCLSVCVLTGGSAAPSAGWNLISAEPEERVELWVAARWWFCSRDPRKRFFRGCRCGPPSLQ